MRPFSWLLGIMLVIVSGCAATTSTQSPASSPAPTATAPARSLAPALAAVPEPDPASVLGSLTVAQKTVVVADFEGGSVPPREETQFWNRALASLLLADLQNSKNLRIVDRRQLAEVLREQRLSASDLSDPATRLRVGRIVGASFFIFGTYTILGDTAILVARMDNVETSQVVKAEQVTGKTEEMRRLARYLAVAFLRGLDVTLEEQEEQRVADVGGPPMEAVRYFSEGFDYESQGLYDKAIEMYTKALTLYPKYQEAREHLERASEKAVR
ncbi:MAG: CsgG/HfaB family protein [Candidatus Binatia bacterium]